MIVRVDPGSSQVPLSLDLLGTSRPLLTFMTRYRGGSRAILVNSLASSLKVGRMFSSIIQPGDKMWEAELCEGSGAGSREGSHLENSRCFVPSPRLCVESLMSNSTTVPWRPSGTCTAVLGIHFSSLSIVYLCPYFSFFFSSMKQ